jgi:hypothetical protein
MSDTNIRLLTAALPTLLPSATGFLKVFLIEEPSEPAVLYFEPIVGWTGNTPVTASTDRHGRAPDVPWGVMYANGRVRDPELGWFDDILAWARAAHRRAVRDRGPNFGRAHKPRRGGGPVRKQRRRRHRPRRK